MFAMLLAVILQVAQWNQLALIPTLSSKSAGRQRLNWWQTLILTCRVLGAVHDSVESAATRALFTAAVHRHALDCRLRNDVRLRRTGPAEQCLRRERGFHLRLRHSFCTRGKRIQQPADGTDCLLSSIHWICCPKQRSNRGGSASNVTRGTGCDRIFGITPRWPGWDALRQRCS